MRNVGFSQKIILTYFSSMAFVSIAILIWMLRSPSEPGNSILFGLSLPRLILAIGFFIAFLLFAGLSVKAIRTPEWARRFLEQWFGGNVFSRGLFWFAAISLGLGWTGCFLPSYRAGFLNGYWDRIQPIAVFLLCIGLGTLLLFLVQRINFAVLSIKDSTLFRLAIVLFVAAVVLLALMLLTKYGLFAREDFWYGAGVPILTLQLMIAIVAGFIFLLVQKHFSLQRLDIVVIILLYAVTAILWAREPLQKSFLFTEPQAPNQEYYPFADAAAFDAGSQFALIGQGIYIFNSPFNDRPLYLSLLIYLHSLFGQDYQRLMAAQAAVFAVLPVLIYLIGRSLNMRAVGFAAAAIATFRGINSIAGSSMIDMANPKMILSDFPAAIGVALIILLACEWLKQPEQKWSYAIWTGGVLGLTLMIRPHALVIFLFLPFFALLRYGRQWKHWLIACALIGVGVIAVTLPWEIRNVARGGVMYASIVTKVQDVIRTRYHGPQSNTGTSEILAQNLSVVTLQQTRVLSTLYSTNLQQEQACNSIVCFAPKHFLHNTMMSILVLPTSPMLDDLRHTVKGDQSVWRANWQGNFTPSALFFLILNIFFIVLGIAVAWKYQGLPGLVPLAIFVIYNMANAFARTSGGRYIVPADWILPLYFVIGVLFAFRQIANLIAHEAIPFPDAPPTVRTETHHAWSPWITTFFVFTILFGIGLLVPLAEKLDSPRYTNVDRARILQDHETQITQAGFGLEQIDRFLENPGAELLIGRVLYPRSFKLGQGIVSFYFYPFTNMDFPRTGFFLVGPNGQDNIVLPGGIPQYLPQASDALVIGCKEQNYVDALLVIVLKKTDAVYTRWPKSELTCPLKQPVCENNTVCQ
jgi:hypothetical protein